MTAEDHLLSISPEMSKASLIELRKTTIFHCPACLQPVKLKVGNVKIAHFSHTPSATCTSFFSENESPHHLQGKWQFYSFFQSLGYSVTLEHYLPSIQQRPDLLVTRNGRSIAIEVQRSTIPIEHVNERTNGYASIGIETCWILAQSVKVLSNYDHQVVRISLSDFQQSFIHDNTCIVYDVELKTFHYYSSLHYLGGNQFLARHSTLPLRLQTFPFRQVGQCRPETVATLHSKWQARRMIHLQQLMKRNRQGIQHPILRACYQLGVYPTELPNYIGIPIEGAEIIHRHPVEWQLLLYEALSHNSHISIETFFQHTMSQPGTDKVVDVVFQYAEFLLKVVPFRHLPSVAKR
ncbi:competence protein CoiA [Paenisporosarcina cavernae]|uniref:competence protein CoiA n=1 Tax=Paenisporosarcina cavernae TaxID=2320858 RepID=UPI002368C871|nr:competence protein CoiA family protein [Paenisporosarcina cavernae]